MTNLAKIIIGVILFFLFTNPTTAEITTVKIQSNNRDEIVFKSFEFTKNGQVSVAISSASVTSAVTSSLSQPDPSRIGFFLISDNKLSRFARERLSCDLDSNLISILFTFRDLSPPPHSSFNKSYTVTYPDWYTLRFANCDPQFHVTMDVRTEFYNTNKSTTKDYLSAGGGDEGERKNKFPNSFHTLCSLLSNQTFVPFFPTKPHPATTTSPATGDHLHRPPPATTPTDYHSSALYSSTASTHDETSPALPEGYRYSSSWIGRLVLHIWVYNGCAFVPFHRGRTNKGCLMIVIPLQVWATILSIRAESSPFNTDSVCNAGLILLNFICVAAIIIPRFDSCETKHPARKYSEEFTPVVVAYLFIDLILGAIVIYSCHWVSNAANEMASLGFYMVMLYMFMPFEKNKSLPVVRVE
ncbi:hypothetical protein L1887_36144 [Cichorium endivia]|nr:hypothetical protein L1887_36144 [Cichorium endivia]